MDFGNTIALVQSKTFWGALLALVAIIAKAYGLSSVLTWAANPATMDSILTFAGVVGTLGAMFGRFVATKPVTSVLPASK